MKKSTWASLAVLFILIPATLFLGKQIKGRWFYLTCTLIIIELMVPFFLRFEARKPQARELVLVAVMSALAAASRVAFVFLPGFKPIIGIIMISGMAFGPESGFLIGALSVFASNFFYSQGPWTPWQMMAYGFAGFLAGLLFSRNRRSLINSRFFLPIMAGFGFISVLFLVGPLLDCCTVFTVLPKLTVKSVTGIFLAGVPVNLKTGLATAVTLVLVCKPLLWKLDRIQRKYGLLTGECPLKSPPAAN